MLARIKITMAICISLLTSNAYSHSLNKKGAYIKAASGVVLYERLRKKHALGIYEPKIGRTTAPIYLAFGYNSNKNIATEILARFSRFHYISRSARGGRVIDSQTMDSYSLFWSVLLKFPITRRIVPYVIIGPGLSFNRSSRMREIISPGTVQTTPGSSITSFAWNIGLGSELYRSNKVLFDIGYRYVSMGEIGVKAGNGSPRESRKIRAHDVILGLAYKF